MGIPYSQIGTLGYLAHPFRLSNLDVDDFRLLLQLHDTFAGGGQLPLGGGM